LNQVLGRPLTEKECETVEDNSPPILVNESL